MGNPGYITHPDSLLKYTIHFQNTGNFQTSFVAIRDTLDLGLDPSSIQIGASSFPVTMQLQNNVLIFLLNPIYLPDSATDPISSSAMVSFYIKLRKGLTAGTQIHNRAGIYFDFNVAVSTNSTLNTLSDSTLNSSTAISMQIMPNPVQEQANVALTLRNSFTGDLMICDMLGQKIYAKSLNLVAGDYNIALNLKNVQNGMYLVYLTNHHSVSKCVRLLKD